MKSRGCAAEFPAASVAAIDAVYDAGAASPSAMVQSVSQSVIRGFCERSRKMKLEPPLPLQLCFGFQGSGFRVRIYDVKVSTNATGQTLPSAMTESVGRSFRQSFSISCFVFRVSGFRFRVSGFEALNEAANEAGASLPSATVSDFWFRVSDFGYRVQASVIGISGFGFHVQRSEFRVHASGFRVQGSGFRFSGTGFRNHGLGGLRSYCAT